MYLSNSEMPLAIYKQDNINEITEHNIKAVLLNENEKLKSKPSMENQLKAIFLGLEHISIIKYIEEIYAPYLPILNKLNRLVRIPLNNSMTNGNSSNMFVTLIFRQ